MNPTCQLLALILELFRKVFASPISLEQCLCFLLAISVFQELVFVQGDRHRSNFTLLHVDIQFSQKHLLKMLSLLQLMFLVSLSNIKWLKLYALMFGSSIFFPLLYMTFVPVPYSFCYSGSVIYLKIWNASSSNIILFALDCLGYLWSFVIPYGFQDSYFFYFCEK